MICLTGDIHHLSLRINEQASTCRKATRRRPIAGRYLRLIEEFGLKVTFYVTGRTLDEGVAAAAPPRRLAPGGDRRAHLRRPAAQPPGPRCAPG